MAGTIQQSTLRLSVAVLLALLLSACGGKKPAQNTGASVEPDKILFDRALQDIRKGRHTVARLTLQTLINTYPDSEYYAEAALAIADSYFKEGGLAGLDQAVKEYENWIVFFPHLEKAPYALMQIALSHFRRMEKPDRDRTYARLAEEALQRFLKTYPDDPLAPATEQRLREVQEVLAEGEYLIGRFYERKGSPRASVARLAELVERYPLYSQCDRALMMLGTAFERVERGDYAAAYYSRVVRDYPLSEFVPEAKERLTRLGVPVPQPDPKALERMQKDREFDSERRGVIGRALGIVKTGPDVSRAARVGQPNLEPPGEPLSAKDTLNPGGGMSIVPTTPGTGTGTTGGTGSSSPPPPPDNNTGTSSSNPDPPAKAAESSSTPASSTLPNRTDKDAKKEAERKKKEEEKKKKEEEKKKKEEESSSKKKKGLRKIIPW